MKTLTLNLKTPYFDQIKAGTKTHEFRVAKDFWKKRLVGREYDQITICKGYPPKDNTARRLTRPWRGYEMQTVTHPEFGTEPVAVFAIRVN